MIPSNKTNGQADKKSKFRSVFRYYLGRMLFYAWFVYPLIFVLGVAYLGMKVAEIYQRGEPTVASQPEIEVLVDPNSAAGRAEFSKRLVEFSGDVQHWNEQMVGGDLFLGGWIEHLDQFRAFEAHKQGDDLLISFEDDSRDFRADITRGKIVPLPGHISPVEDPMARALTFLLDSWGGKRFCHHAVDALDEVTFEAVIRKGRECLSFDFHCEKDQVDVTLVFEQPKMILRERTENYSNGLELTYTFDDYQPVDDMRLAREVVLTTGLDESFQISISKIRPMFDEPDDTLALSGAGAN